MELNFYLAFIITYKQYISLSFLMAMMFIFLDRTSRKPLGGFVVGLILIFGVRSGLYTELISFISKLQHFQVLVSLVVQYRELFSFLFFFSFWIYLLMYFMCIGTLSMCTSVYQMVISDRCELPCGYWEFNSGPSEAMIALNN